MKDDMTKPQKPGSAAARKFKADDLNALVKREIEGKRAQLESKTARLKAQRLARDAGGPVAAPEPEKPKK
jgi:uncharacterized small protein (DUF1192 family)